MSRCRSALVLVALLAAAGPAAAQAPERMVLPMEQMELPVQTLDGSVERTRTRVRLQADVVFAFGSARLSGRARSRIAAAAADVRARAPRTLTVTGHTDGIGSAADNLVLSQRRAEAVRRALLAEFGPGAPAVRAVGRGEREPVAAETTEDGADSPRGRVRNRRVEVVFG